MSRSMPPKSAPSRFPARFSCRAALFCAALTLECLVAPWGALMGQTLDPQAQAAASAPVPAPAPAPQPRKKRNPTGSPLDTLMSTRLFADVPEAKGFVRETRRPPDSLEFKPTAGTDPERPKVRTKTELDALQSELEGAGRKNAARAGVRSAERPPASAAGAAAKSQGPQKTLAN